MEWKHKSILVIFSSAIMLAASLSFAAPVIPDQAKAGAVEKSTEKTPILKEKTALPEITAPSRPKLDIQNGRKIIVQKFTFTGNKVLSTDKLNALVRPFEGIELTMSQLRDVADTVTQAYWKKGYITSFAYVPAQKIEDGKVEIAVVEGKVGEIKVQGNKYYEERFIEKHLSVTKKEDALNNKTLERGLLLLNDYPKLEAVATLNKGSAPGTTDLLITTKDRLPMNFNFFYNNFGSRYTGKNRLGMTWDWADITGNGDILSITGITTLPHPGDLFYGRGNYQFPLNGYGTKLGLHGSFMDYDVGKELAVLGVEGEATVFGFDVSHPFIVARNGNLALKAGWDIKRYKNYFLDKSYVTSDDKLSVVNVNLSADKTELNCHSFANLGLSFGLGSFLGGMDDRPALPSRLGADGSFAKLNLDLSRLHKFGSCKLIARGSAQWASDILASGEEFILGGADSVRGYPAGEFLGDNAYFVGAEIRTPIVPGEAKINKYANWAFFVDHGGVYSRQENDKNHQATGLGGGFRIYVPCHYEVRFDVGFPVLGEEPSDGKHVRYYLQAVVSF